MLLAATTDKIQLVTDATITVDVHVVFAEFVKASGAAVSIADKQNTAITTATTTDILGAPGSNNVRKVKFMTIRNKHASSSVGVTVVFDQNGTDFELHKVTLKAGECLEYVEDVGYFILSGAPLLDTTVRVSSDATNATTSFADITGLTVPIAANKNYTVELWLHFQTNATTTGARFALNGPASPTNLRIGGLYGLTHGLAGAFGSASVTAYDTAVPAHTTGPGATDGLGHVIACVENGANAGNLVGRFQSEIAVASGLIVRRGSWMRVREIG